MYITVQISRLGSIKPLILLHSKSGVLIYPCLPFNIDGVSLGKVINSADQHNKGAAALVLVLCPLHCLHRHSGLSV